MVTAATCQPMACWSIGVPIDEMREFLSMICVIVPAYYVRCYVTVSTRQSLIHGPGSDRSLYTGHNAYNTLLLAFGLAGHTGL